MECGLAILAGQADNLKFLDSIKIFDGLNQKQKAACLELACKVRGCQKFGHNPLPNRRESAAKAQT